MLDIIDSKLYRPKASNKKSPSKNICITNFKNKAIEYTMELSWYIKLSKTRNKSCIAQKIVLAQLSRELPNKENRPLITYKLTITIRNKILNYKDCVN